MNLKKLVDGLFNTTPGSRGNQIYLQALRSRLSPPVREEFFAAYSLGADQDTLRELVGLSRSIESWIQNRRATS